MTPSRPSPPRPPGRPRPIPGLTAVLDGVVYPHVFGQADREVGGVLVGAIPVPGGPPRVEGAIPAMHADEQAASLTFTHATWSHVHGVLAQQPGAEIVGWYHSHPGFGIFLSAQDLFIHRNFFSGPSQIAVVVDPLAGTEGVFIWYAGEIIPFFERPTAQPGIRVAQPSARARIEESSPQAAVTVVSNRWRWSLGVLAIVALVAVAVLIWQARAEPDVPQEPTTSQAGLVADVPGGPVHTRLVRRKDSANGSLGPS